MSGHGARLLDMWETTEELSALQDLLDSSHAGATDHLRGIISDDRTLRAREIADLMTGMRVLSIATVTAKGEPRVSAMDGHFLHGRWTLGTDPRSAKGRQLQARPAVRAAYVEGGEMAVFTHGQVGILTPEHPERDEQFAARGVEPEVRPSDDLPGWSGQGCGL